MREVNIGSKQFTVVHAVDEPGLGGACHEYRVRKIKGKSRDLPLAVVHFQNGPIKEAGVNGCHQEDLIAICIDRLQAYQLGAFKCDENQIALEKLREALHWLKQRTQDRVKRGVEGTYNE